MFTFFLILAVVGIIALLFYLVVELNELEKAVSALVEKLKKHYEPQ